LPAIIFFLLATSLACTAMALLPQLAMIPAIAWGVFLIVAGVYLDTGKILFIYLVNITLLFIITEAGTFLIYLAFFGIAAMVMSLLVSCKRDYYQVQKAGVVTAVLGVSLFLLSSYLYLGGIGISELEASLNQSAEESIRIYEEIGLFEAYEQMGVSSEEFENLLKGTTAAFARHLPAIYYNQAIIAVFLMLLMAAWVSPKSQLERLKKMPFREERMPWQLVWLAIAGLGLWIWGRDELNVIYYIGSNLLWIIVPIAIYFGLATIVHTTERQKRSTRIFTTTGLILMALIYPLFVIIVVSLIGLFDSLVDFRRKLGTGQEE